MRDVNGNVLNGVDTVTVISDLKVKGSSIPLKQGTVIRNIRLVQGDDEHIEGSSDKIKGLVLKVCFLKQAWRPACASAKPYPRYGMGGPAPDISCSAAAISSYGSSV